MPRLPALILTVLLTITSPLGCSTAVPYAFDDFVRDLRRVGATIDVAPSAEVDHGFSIPGRRIVVNRANIFVYEFSNSLEALEAARTVSPDGYNITRTDGAITTARHADWIEPPHFYQRGQLIAIYAGRDAGIKNLLTSLLSPPFAGSETNFRGEQSQGKQTKMGLSNKRATVRSVRFSAPLLHGQQ